MLHMRKDLTLVEREGEVKEVKKDGRDGLLKALKFDDDELSFMKSIVGITNKLGGGHVQNDTLDMVSADFKGGEDEEDGGMSDILAALEAGDFEEDEEDGGVAGILAALEAGDVEVEEIGAEEANAMNPGLAGMLGALGGIVGGGGVGGSKIDQLCSALDEGNVNQKVYGDEGAVGGDNLEGLVGDLLKALKTDEGREKFKELAAEEDPNIEVPK